MEILHANSSSKIRYAKLHGREHIVAPLTLIVPGVLNGSLGAIHYPPEEVGRDPSIWNHVPIVVYHPIVNGQYVSARDPEILDLQGIGVVLRSRFNGKKLVAEGWFDVEKTSKVDNRIMDSLLYGKPIELSTGLYIDNEPAPQGAAFNGRSYSFIARNYCPDHLAILPDQVGACSLTDGCGVLVNAKKTAGGRWVTLKNGVHIQIDKKGRVVGGPKGLVSKLNDSGSKKRGFKDAKDEAAFEKASARQDRKEAKADKADKSAQKEGFKDAGDKAKFEEASKRQDAKEALAKIAAKLKEKLPKTEAKAKAQFHRTQTDAKEALSTIKEKLTKRKQSKLTIDKAAAGLEKKGYKLEKQLDYDLKNQKAMYQVKTPDGKSKAMSSSDIKDLLSGVADATGKILQGIASQIAGNREMTDQEIEDILNNARTYKRDSRGRFASGGGGAFGGGPSTTKENVPHGVNPEQHATLIDAGYEESGGGDDFTSYMKDANRTADLHDDGSWKLYDQTKAKFDVPVAQGKGANSLKKAMSTGNKPIHALEAKGFQEIGGGDDFTSYQKPGKKIQVDIKDDGTWEAFKDGYSTTPMAKGKSKSKLDKFLSANQGYSMRTLSQEERLTLVGAIVGNCACQAEDVDALGDLSDKALLRMARNAMPPQFKKKTKKKPAVPHPDMESEAEDATDTTSEEEEQMTTEHKKMAGNQSAEKPAEKKPQTFQEWMASAPPEVQAVVSNALTIEKREKDELIGKLTANLKNEDQKKKMAANLGTKSLDELRDLLLLVPEAPKSQPLFFGQNAPAVNKASETDRNDILPLPTINWKKVD